MRGVPSAHSSALSPLFPSTVERQPMTRPRLLALLCILIGLTCLGNGVWMLFAPLSWFDLIPAAMEDTGSPNRHLIRDVGLAYGVVGAALVWCARHLARARVVFLGAALFLVGHAISHGVEILIGQLPATHWLIDAPLVFLPALVVGVLAVPSVWKSFVGTPAP